MARLGRDDTRALSRFFAVTFEIALYKMKTEELTREDPMSAYGFHA
jgi:hypothetical protein